MRKIIPSIVGLILVAVAALPFINIRVMAPGEWFPWLFFCAGTAGFYTLFLRVTIWVKVASILMLINAFTSAVPMLSYIAYIQFMAVVYFFILCQSVQNYRIIFALLQSFLLFNLFMIFTQAVGTDSLMNFKTNSYYGTIGQHMQMASFSVILSAALMLKGNNFNFSLPFAASVTGNSAGGFISTGAGMVAQLPRILPKQKKIIFFVSVLVVCLTFIWLKFTGKLSENMSTEGGRLGVYFSTLKLANQRPLFGWGMGTFKALFPAMTTMETIPWKTTHNCWLQIYYETGILGLTTLLSWTGYLIFKLKKLCRRAIFREKSICCMSAIFMISVNMIFHFPTRMIQCVLLIIFVLAYCDKVIILGNNSDQDLVQWMGGKTNGP